LPRTKSGEFKFHSFRNFILDGNARLKNNKFFILRDESFSGLLGYQNIIGVVDFEIVRGARIFGIDIRIFDIGGQIVDIARDCTPSLHDGAR
jgi:hypothetical protein